MPETETIAPCGTCGESKVHKEHSPTACLKRKLMNDDFPASEFGESDEDEVRYYPSTHPSYVEFNSDNNSSTTNRTFESVYSTEISSDVTITVSNG